jgi:hypothetical protein
MWQKLLPHDGQEAERENRVGPEQDTHRRHTPDDLILLTMTLSSTVPSRTNSIFKIWIYQWINSLMKAQPSSSNHFLKAPPLNVVCTGNQTFSTWDFGEDNSYPNHNIPSHNAKCFQFIYKSAHCFNSSSDVSNFKTKFSSFFFLECLFKYLSAIYSFFHGCLYIHFNFLKNKMVSFFFLNLL